MDDYEERLLAVVESAATISEVTFTELNLDISDAQFDLIYMKKAAIALKKTRKEIKNEGEPPYKRPRREAAYLHRRVGDLVQSWNKIIKTFQEGMEEFSQIEGVSRGGEGSSSHRLLQVDVSSSISVEDSEEGGAPQLVDVVFSDAEELESATSDGEKGKEEEEEEYVSLAQPYPEDDDEPIQLLSQEL